MRQSEVHKTDFDHFLNAGALDWPMDRQFGGERVCVNIGLCASSCKGAHVLEVYWIDSYQELVT